MASKLKEIADAQREVQIAKNIYKGTNVYNGAHPNAISDGDDKGKGGVGDNAGSASDITARHKQLATNKFNSQHPYDIGRVV